VSITAVPVEQKMLWKRFISLVQS